MQYVTEALTQQVAAGEWNANASNVSVIATAEAFVRWPGLAKNGGTLRIDWHGTYSFNNATPITEDVWLFLSNDGAVFHTHKLAGILSTVAGFGTMFGWMILRSSGVARQEVLSYAEVCNPSNTGATPQVFRQHDRWTQDFSVDRRILLSIQKQASTPSQFNVRSVSSELKSLRL